MLLTRRTTLRLALFTGILAATVGLASGPFAGGGIALWVDIPRPDDDQRLKDVAFIARTRGCMGPNSTITVTAEGLVDGKRVSKILTPIDASTKHESYTLPILGIRREWPTTGNWIISIVADAKPWDYTDQATGKQTRGQWQESVIVPILPDGSPEMRSTPGAKYEHHVNFISTNKEDRDKTIARFLTTRSTRSVGAVRK